MFANANRPKTVVRHVAKPREKDKSGSSTPKIGSDTSSRSPRPSQSLKPPSVNGRLRHSASPSVRPPRSRTPPQKRKVPQIVQHWDSDSSSDVSDIDLLTNKRFKLDSRSPQPPAITRRAFDLKQWTEEDVKKALMRHSTHMTGGEYARLYRPAFGEGEARFVSLQYPSNGPRERFEMVIPTTKDDDYSPIKDLIDTIEHICRVYIPETMSRSMLDDSTGYARRLKRAIRDQSFESFKAIIKEFNKMLKMALDDGTVAKHLLENPLIDLPLVERITEQAYSRTVSPKAESLNKYEAGSDHVYGEILSRFATEIFTETNLTADKVFIDMGSGVGNVVLQAALQIGCESWGAENAPTPASLGAEQLVEFHARCKLWGIKPGRATLLNTSFLESSEIDAAWKRADAVLINNKVFSTHLNGALLMKMLDLKDGCKVVSLKSFVPRDWKIKPHNVNDHRNMLSVVSKEYISKSVSWAESGGEYFIATKDSNIVKKYVEGGSV